jgi:diguanylate cyclase (GGDEF)-like protein/PAS domain S-box-containing protein
LRRPPPAGIKQSGKATFAWEQTPALAGSMRGLHNRPRHHEPLPRMPAIPAPPARDEATRLAALRELQLLDTLPEPVYDDLVLLAAEICGTPIGLVSLVDSDRQWFKARVGMEVDQTHRDLAFCAHAIVADEPVFVVEDAAKDARFRDNPLVRGAPHIRFYAGAPIVMADGQALGTVCVIDTEPRRVDASQRRALQALARQAGALFELRRATFAAQRQAQALQQLSAQAAEERRRSAELLDLVLRGGNLGLWDLRVADGSFTANDREYEMLGYPTPEQRPAALDWRTLVHPDDWPVLNAAIVPHLAGEAAFYACEHRMRGQDGSWVWVLAHAIVAERDAGGAPQRIVGTHMDIGARIRDGLALQRARGLLDRMGALAKVGGWELDIASGKLSWTDEVYRIHDVGLDTEVAMLGAIEFYAPAARPTIEAAVERAMADGTPWDLELPFVTARGRALTVRAKGEATIVHGQAVRLFGTFQDVTERKAAEEALAERERQLRLITDNVPALIAYIDREQRYRFLNAHIQREFGTDVVATLGCTMLETRGEATYARLAPHVEAALRGEKRSFVYTEEVGGRTSHLQSNYVPDVDPNGEVKGFYALTFDVTELRETQRQLELLTRVDMLTGLPNRRQFDETLRGAMLRTRRTMRPMAVMFLDIDHFKAVNDAHGHAGGDAVLCEVGRRLTASIRATDLVARLSGDEFVIVLEGIDGVLELGRVAEKVVACVRPRIEIEGKLLAVTVSLGVTIYRGGDPSASDLLALADAALYRAKQQGRNRFSLA